MSLVDYVLQIRVIGGEPLMYKKIDSVVKHLLTFDNVETIQINTNGTIVPNDEKMKVFENNKVRVLKVTDRNGDTQPLHALLDRVVVHLSPCAWMNEDDNGKTSMQSHKFGDVYWSNAVVRGGRTSTVIQECQSIEIEIKNHQI